MGTSINSILLFAIVALVVLVAVRLVLLKPQNKQSPTKAARTSQPTRKPVATNRFRSVSIVAPASACAAAARLVDKHFLVADNNAPSLPLADCDAATCTCTYKHHSDRREQGDDRRSLSGLRTQLHTDTGNAERRKTRGRRSTDT